MTFSPISPVAVAELTVVQGSSVDGLSDEQKLMSIALLSAMSAQVAIEWCGTWYEFGQAVLESEAKALTLAYGREGARDSAHRSAGAAWACHKAWEAYHVLAGECMSTLGRCYREHSDALEVAIKDAQRYLLGFTPPGYRAPTR